MVGKRRIPVSLVAVGLVCAQLVWMGAMCEGPVGPAGPEGPAGQSIIWKGVLQNAPAEPQINWAYYNTTDTVAYIYDGAAWDTMYVGLPGPAGANGVDGVDMNACGVCHNSSTDLVVKKVQWEASVHATGGHHERGTSTSCAACHASEGFVTALAENKLGQSVSTAPTATSPIGCRTCHMVHTKFDSTDWALRTSAAATINLTGDQIDVGKGNLCISCHQPRVGTFGDLIAAVDSFNVGSTRYGPHHGPQGSLLAGVAGYEHTGETYSFGASHKLTDDGCVTCHMAASSYPGQAGGHTFNMGYDDHGHTVINSVGCAECHKPDSVQSMVETLHAEVGGLMDSLATLLAARGVVKIDSVSGAVSIVTGMHSVDEAGALWNYKTIEEDRSGGVHNPGYVRALLSNSIAALNK